MLIKITELCTVENEKSRKERIIIYDSPSNKIKQCLKDYKDNFNIDNVISCNDNFDNCCLESEIVKIEKV